MFKLKEVRYLPTEVRVKTEEGKPKRATGSGLVYGQRSQNLGGQKWPFYEIIEAGAFAQSVRQANDGERVIKSYFNHDPNQVLATTRSNPPLTVLDTDEGVFYDAEIPDTSYGRDLEINLERRNVEGSSFSFEVTADEWEEADDGTVTRTIKEGIMYELGPVTDPAYLQTSATARSAEDAYKEFRAKSQEDEARKQQADEEQRQARQKEAERRERDLKLKEMELI